ncbi:MAG: alpha/beta fold hydrolase [Alphaproteobacteria bacterium]
MAVNREKLVVTDQVQAPEGARVQVLRMVDGTEIRTAVWPVPANTEPAGTVVLFHGRTEFIEKYYEVIGELQARGFAVLTFDWRGQGLSSRLLTHPLKGHVDRFCDYVDDARAIIDHLLTDDLPTPHVLMAHSMGGNIALRFIQENPVRFSRAVLCAPMTGIRTAPVPGLVTRGIAIGMILAGRATAFVSRSGGKHPRQEAFKGNRVTSDADRFRRTIRLLEAEPALGLNGITWRWLREALVSCDRVMDLEQAQTLSIPILLASAAGEKIVDGNSHARFAALAPTVRHVTIAEAEHEILQERDAIRTQFWTAFDAFVAEGASPSRSQAAAPAGLAGEGAVGAGAAAAPVTDPLAPSGSISPPAPQPESKPVSDDGQTAAEDAGFDAADTTRTGPISHGPSSHG